MSFGQFLSNAGVAATSMRAAEESERVARENQLKIEEQNRFAAFKARMAQDAAKQRPQVLAPQFSTTIDPSSIPGGQQFPVDVIPPPAAAPAPAPAPDVTPSIRRMSPDEVARLTNPPPYGQDVSNPNFNEFDYKRISDAANFHRLKIKGFEENLAKSANPAERSRIQQFLENEKRLLAGNESALSRMQPSTIPFGLEGRNVSAPKAALPKPPKPDKATQYDSKVTPYDALIQQSAIQYGIDPVVFKRLLGTESSFNPTAVSPRGESFGLGIAQIASSHGLSREQRLDPNIAIPAGAQIFATMLNKAGGNYELALQRYKGASSEQGKAAMAGPISIILSGLVPSAQADVPAAAAPAAAAPAAAAPAAAAPAAAAPAAAAPAPVVRTDADFYLANPQSIPYEFQQLTQAYQQAASQAQEEANLVTQQRNETARLAQMYMQSGTTTGIDTAMKMRDVINNYDIELLKLKQGVDGARTKVTQGRVYLEGMQGLQDLALGNDPRRLASVWSQYAGVPIGIQPRSDGTFNIMVNGKKTKEGVTPAELSNTARLAFDQTYRQQQAAAGAEMNKFMSQERYKSMLTIQQGNAAELAKMIREIAVENTKGNNAQALEWAKANFGWDIKPSGAGDGTLTIKPPNSAPYVYNPTGRTIEIDGIKIQSNAAQLISGLPIPTQQRLNAVR
jgi:hypothetical protein